MHAPTPLSLLCPSRLYALTLILFFILTLDMIDKRVLFFSFCPCIDSNLRPVTGKSPLV